MPQDRVPLYVRLPRDQAASLDRLVEGSGLRKQQVVSDLIADRLPVGRIGFVPEGDEKGAVLTLDEVTALLRISAAAVHEQVAEHGLPGRSIAGEWRFSRAAVMDWLGGREAGA